MAWKETKVGAEEKFNELKTEYLSLISDPSNRTKNRQPNNEVEHYYNNALDLLRTGNVIMARTYMNMALNMYKTQLGIRRNNSS